MAENDKQYLSLATSASKKNVTVVLGHKGLKIKNRFDLIVCGDEFYKSKPDPDIFLVVRNFFSKSRKFLVIEDSPFGIQAVKKAGMECIAVPNEFTMCQNLNRADLVITDLSRQASIT